MASDTRDHSIQDAASKSAPVPQLHYDLADNKARSSSIQQLPTLSTVQSDPSGAGAGAGTTPLSPEILMKRRLTRSGTVKTFSTVDRTPREPSWHPGQEPGLDPEKPNGGRNQTPLLHAECQITVVDFSEDDMVMRDFDNKSLISFLEKPQPDWVNCRWINVNRLSWDVVQALSKYKNFHKLAVEDLFNRTNRTKADW